MKKIIFIFLALTGFMQLNAQADFIENFYEKYEGLEDVTSFNLGGNFLNNLHINEDGKEFTSSLEKLYVLTLPHSIVSTSDLNALKKNISRSHFEELIRVRDGKEWVIIYIKESKDFISDLLVMVDEIEEEVVLVSLSGKMTYEDLNQINIDGKAGDAIKEIPSSGRGN